MGHAAVDNMRFGDAVFEGLEAGVDFREHAAGDDAVGGQTSDGRGVEG